MCAAFRGIRRKRGRPSNADIAARAASGGDAGSDSITVEPIEPDAGAIDGGDDSGSDPDSGTRGPRRSSGTGGGRSDRKEKKASLDVDFVSGALLTITTIMAARTKADVALNETEAKAVAKAMANVARHYDIPMMTEKNRDWIALATVVGGIYVPRVVGQLREKKAATKPAEAAQPSDENVTSLFPDFSNAAD